MESSNSAQLPSQEFKVSIFRVPKSLLKGDEASYLPEVVRLGVFYGYASSRDAEDYHFQETDKEKQLLFQKYEDYNKSDFQQLAKRSIQCYQVEGLHLDDKTIAKVMLEDALYILKNVRSLTSEHRSSRKPLIILTEIMKDILKLQNQIPLPLLKAVYKNKYEKSHGSFEVFLKQNLSAISPFRSPGAVELTDSVRFPMCQHLLQCCHEMVLGVATCTGETPPSNEVCIQNLLHCCHGDRDLGCETPSTGGSSLSNEIYLKNASELSKAGIRFKPLPENCTGIRHIKFDEKQCTLYLPRMSIGLVYSEVIWKNLIAFELCSPDIKEKAVLSFVHFMDDLINVKDDIQLFIKNKIFFRVRNDQMATQFRNTLSKSTAKPEFRPIDDAAEKMNRAYKSRKWRWLWNEFKDSRTWTKLSAILTIFVGLSTLVQVTCAFYTCNTIFLRQTSSSP